jgi:hypothetical protein
MIVMNNKSTKKKRFEQYGNELYFLANAIASILAENKLDNTTQKEQVEELLEAEKLFKQEILKYKFSTQVYKKFIQKIRYLDRNILYSKIYFREGSTVFSKEITPCLKSEDAEGLKKFNVNFNLIQFIKNNWRGSLGHKAEKLYKRVERARKILIENNLPLSINVAKLFYRKVPRSSVSLMDMIAVSAMGLASAIDKYTGDSQGQYSEVFRSVIIGRANGNLIKLYSETSLHFYPSDRKVLYKANSVRGRQGITEIKELAEAVNLAFLRDREQGLNSPKKPITSGELEDLLHAASLISVEATLDENNFTIYDRIQDENLNAEERLIGKETSEKISKLIKALPVIHRKVLKLKGISF